MVPSPDGRSQRFAHRRGELLDAAAEYVLERGVTETSLRPMATALGVTHKTLLQHFGTKERLFIEVMRELRERERRVLLQRTAAATGDQPDALDVLRVMFERLAAPDHDPFLRLLFELVGRALHDPEEQFGRFLAELVDDWTAAIELVLREHGLAEPQAKRLARFVYDAVRGLLLDLVSTRERDRVDEAFEELIDLVEHRLRTLAEAS
jgi:AcrR family transcriptional regulator